MPDELSVRLSTPLVRVVAETTNVRVSPGALPAVLGAHLGLISEATEVLDPSGLLVAASDLEDGSGVRIEVSGDVAIDPSAGVSWSTPLRTPLGTLHPPLADIQRLPVQGAFGIDEISPWTTKATPSHGVVWIAILDGPLSSATAGIMICSHNDAAGEQRVGYGRLAGGVWGAMNTSNTSDAGQSGVDADIGNGWGGSSAGYTICAIPRDGYTGFAQRALSTMTYGLNAGQTPHLCWGVYQPMAGPGGAIEIAPLAELWPARLPEAR